MSSDISGQSQESAVYRTVGPSVSRRGFLRAGAATAGAGAVGVGGMRSDYGPAQEAEAIAPALAAGLVAVGMVGAAGAGAAVGWALREWEVIGADDPPEGTTPETLVESQRQALKFRRSSNLSTFVDNSNWVENGMKHAGHAEGKIEAIEAINDQKSQSDVLEAAQNRVDEFFTTPLKNVAESWDETLRLVHLTVQALEDHPDIDMGDGGEHDSPMNMALSIGIDDKTHTFPDGSEMDLNTIQSGGMEDFLFSDPGEEAETEVQYNPHNFDSDTYSTDDLFHVATASWDQNGDPVEEEGNWAYLVQKIEDAHTSVKDGIALWVDSVYGDVQAGDLDPEDLLTPRELAEMTTDDEDFNQAIADLMALNVAVDLEREAEIYLPGIDATVFGSLAYTGDGTVSTGTVDPESEDGHYYLTYDISQGQGEWSAYDDSKGVDGGEVHFNQQPFPDTRYYIETVAGEIVSVEADDFTAYDSHDEEYDGFDEAGEADYWEVDVSDQLDDAVTDIEEISFTASVDETQYETVLLRDQFEIVTFRDSDGEEHDEAEFTQSDPQDDENYITEDEWQEMYDRQSELIDKYEEAMSGGGGGWFGDGGGGGIVAVAIGVLALIIAVFNSNN